MSKKNGFSDYFDDDFEVTYEEDPDFLSEDPEKEYTSQETIVMQPDEYERKGYNRSRRDYEDRSYDRNYDDHSYDRDYDDQDYKKKSRSSRRRKNRGVPLAAPIRKGGRALSRLTSALVRCFTAVLILVISAYVTWTFWRASTPYGDIMESIQNSRISPTLAAYLCAPALFLLFEFISLCWSLTRVRVRDGFGTWKEDTGRGLFSFIIVFVTSYLAFLLSRFLPESPEDLARRTVHLDKEWTSTVPCTTCCSGCARQAWPPACSENTGHPGKRRDKPRSRLFNPHSDQTVRLPAQVILVSCAAVTADLLLSPPHLRRCLAGRSPVCKQIKGTAVSHGFRTVRRYPGFLTIFFHHPADIHRI